MKVVQVNFAEKRRAPAKQAAPAVVLNFPKRPTAIVRAARNPFLLRGSK